MCGRFTHAMTWSQVYHLYNIHNEARRAKNTPPRYNICPTDTVEFVYLYGSEKVYAEGRWGLVPPFFSDTKKGPPLINARIETVDKLPVFRDAFARTRCLIPADGYYEWTIGLDKGKDPHWIHMPGADGFSFAGLYAVNSKIDPSAAPLMSCSIITGPAEPPVDAIHDRQPLILDQADYDAWLDPNTPASDLFAILGRHINDRMEFHRVDRQVNSNRWQGGPEAIQPV